MAATPGSAASFSLTEARSIVRDLFVPDARIYWVDFSPRSSWDMGATLWRGTPVWRPLSRWNSNCSWPRQRSACNALVISSVMFVHEIVHLPEKKLRMFASCGICCAAIPFLVPSFTYYTHLDHHRRKMFGTENDGEYLPLARMSPGWILLYLSQGLWVPPLAVIRFWLDRAADLVMPAAAALDSSAGLIASNGSELHSAAAEAKRLSHYPPARGRMLSVFSRGAGNCGFRVWGIGRFRF